MALTILEEPDPRGELTSRRPRNGSFLASPWGWGYPSTQVDSRSRHTSRCVRVLPPLGTGGMGEVYRARDPKLDREVAIKVLPSDVSSNEDRRARFEREARAASALNHPNIVTIHDFSFAGPTFYMVMERVDGRTLRNILAARPLPMKRIMESTSSRTGSPRPTPPTSSTAT